MAVMRAAVMAAVVAVMAVAQEAREGKQLNDAEQKYDLELSFPVDDVEATNESGAVRRIDSLIQEILLATGGNLGNLPGTELDPSSIIFEESYRCESGEVVVDEQCVPCPPGTFFEELLGSAARCSKCPVGEFNPDAAQRSCRPCGPGTQGNRVTESEGATSENQCKQECEPGSHFDEVTQLCLDCGHGWFQENKGKFSCDLCEVGKTTRTKNAVSREDCRPDCQSGHQLSVAEECEECPRGTYRKQGTDRECRLCTPGRTTAGEASESADDCNIPVCLAGQFLNASDNACQACPVGTYQDEQQQTFCLDCPANTSTDDIGIVRNVGAVRRDQCSNPCLKAEGSKRQLCDRNANCLFDTTPGRNTTQRYTCSCKTGYKGDGRIGGCMDSCHDYCMNDGTCVKKKGEPYCQCAGSFNGKHCEEKSEFAYIAGGIAGAVLFIIVLVLLIWMICVRSSRGKRSLGQEKFAQPGADGVNGSQVNFYYGQPAPYAESIAPSQHGSTYAHYYEDDQEDGWGMPNFYDTYGKNSKMARSNGSLYNAGAGMYGPQYAPQGELYDRLGRHAYQPRPEDKSAGDTTSESEDERRGSQ